MKRIKLTKTKIMPRGGDMGRSALEEQFGFTIDTAQAAKMIEANGYVTYTMLIKRDSVSNAFFENLLITVDSTDSKSAHIVKYNLTTPILINDHGAYYYESTKEMTTLYNERMNFGWLNCQNVVFPMCDIHGGSYNYDHVFMGWETCRVAYYHSEWVCTMPGPPDEGGGGNPPPPTPPNGPGGSNGPGGPITIPLPELENNQPCEELKKKLTSNIHNNPYTSPTNPHIDIALNQLTTKLGEPNEFGYAFRIGNQTIGSWAINMPNTGEDYVHFPCIGYYFGGAHSHPFDGHKIPMFSHDDIYSLLKFKNCYTGQNLAGDNLFVTVGVFEQGGVVHTYAIKIENFAKFEALMNKYEAAGNKGKWSKFGRELAKMYEKNANGVNGTPKQYQREFLKFLEDGDAGIALYEMTVLDAGTASIRKIWEKLTLNPNGQDIDRTPCK